ncbi:MAG: tetratricopeptide repeat protein [Candidatus Eremiobacteraeota bacterium]|nr:tetratricopeptide repeat protein [Candidatus Eremiobacteraeota bacterium]
MYRKKKSAMEKDIYLEKFLLIFGCSVDSSGVTVNHEKGQSSIPWDSLTHAFLVYFKKKGIHNVPFFLLKAREFPQYFLLDGSALGSMKLMFEGVILMRRISIKRAAVKSSPIDDEFRDVVSRICGKFSWTFVDGPLRDFLKQGTASLPLCATLEELATYCDKVVNSSQGISEEAPASKDYLKEIQTLTGPITSREEWREGRIIDNRYIIQQVLMGGMGIVYVALDNLRARFYAIKTFQEKYLWEETVIQQFIREAEIWINLGKHMNIVQAERVMQREGKPYIILEYIQGSDLDTLLKEGLLAVHTSLDYALQFCDGMHYAFQRLGLVHRDIKPSNCFITRDQVIKISDFGLGKIVYESTKERKGFSLSAEKDKDVLASAAMVGTLPFMAPELFTDIKSASIKTDIYAFGVMLYQMLTGLNPFLDDDPTEVIERHLTLFPDDPSQVNPEVPPAMKAIVDKCIEKDPQDRYNDFSEITRDLREVFKSVTGSDFVQKSGENTFSEEDWIKKGLSLASLKLHREAIITFNEAFKLNNRSPAIIHKGISLSALGEYEKALEAFDEFQKLHPDYWKVWYHKGDTLRQCGNYEEALSHLEKAMSLTSQHGIIIGAIGKVMEEQGKLTEALEYYDKALEKSESMAEVWDYKGVLLMRMQRYPQAQEAFSEAVELNPRYLEAWFHRGLAFYELGFFSEAIKAHNLVLSLDGEYVPSLMGIGDCYRELREYTRSLDFYQKAISVDPESLPAQLAKVRLLVEASRYEEALDYINTLYEKNRENDQLLAELVQVYFELGLYNESYELCRDLQKRDRGNFRLALLLKCTRNWLAELRRLMEDIEECDALEKSFILKDLNTLLCVTCSVDGAKELLRYYLEHDDEPDTVLHLYLAFLEKMSGDNEKALSYIDRLNEASKKDDAEALNMKKVIMDSFEEKSSGLKFFSLGREEKRSPQEWMVFGIEKLHKNELKEALEAFQKALGKDPHLHACWYFGAKVFEAMGNSEEANRYFNNFIQSFPQSPGFYRELIKGAGDSMDFESCATAHRRWIGYFPDDHRGWISYLKLMASHGYREQARILAMEIITTYSGRWFLGKSSREYLFVYGLLLLFIERFKGAAEIFEALLKEYPDECPSAFALARIKMQSGKLSEAESLLKKLSAVEDVSLLALYELASLYLRENLPDKAFKVINDGIALRKSSFELLFRKAEVLCGQQNYTDGLELAYKLCMADKKFIPALLLHNSMLMAKKRPSTDLLTRALPVNQKNLYLLKAIAFTSFTLEEYGKTIAGLDLAVTWNRLDRECLLAQGIAHYRTGSFTEAFASFQKAAEVTYRNLDLWLYLGAVNYHLGNEALSETFFRQALLQDNISPPALVNLGVLLYEKGSLLEAQQWAEKAIRLKNDYGPAWHLRARCLRAYGNLEEAEKSIESALRALPDALPVWVLRGVILMEQKKISEGMLCFKKASEMAPKEPAVWFNLALIAFIDNKIDHAFKCVNQALLLFPLFFEALFLNSLCLLRLEKISKSQECMRKAEEVDEEKAKRWQKLQAIQNNVLAPLKGLELAREPFSLPGIPTVVIPDPVSIFDLEYPEEIIPIVKEFQSP